MIETKADPENDLDVDYWSGDGHEDIVHEKHHPP